MCGGDEAQIRSQADFLREIPGEMAAGSLVESPLKAPETD